MELSPDLKKLLEKLGVNTTRLQWRLHEWEKRRAQKRPLIAIPSWLQWMRYTHKFCPQCRSLAAKDEQICPSCGAKLQPMFLYKIMRTVGLAFPEGSAPTAMIFLGVMCMIYMISILKTDLGSILNPSGQTLYQFGLFIPDSSTWSESWRWLACGLMHIGLIHLGFNTMSLIQIGPFLESELGARRMLVLITVTQISTALAMELSRKPGVGASGWIFGLIGFGVVYFHRYGKWEIRNFLLRWAAYGFVFGMMVGAHNAAHLGGALGGAALGLVAELTRARRTWRTVFWEFLAWPSLALWILTLVFLARSILAPTQFG